MKSFHSITRALGILTVLLVAGTAVHAQIVINELVTDERTAGSSQTDDTRQFLELYNSGSSTVDISGWSIDSYTLDDGNLYASDFLPGGATIAPGGYYVIGSANVPNINYDLGTVNIWPNDNVVFELRDNSTNLVDAVAPSVYAGAHGQELAFATPDQLGQIGTGWWGQVLSANTSFPQSLARYQDGRDTNSNGRDFGMIPLTPGASNNLPQVGVFTAPDVDSQSVGSTVAGFGGSFVLPKVINPTVVSSANPNAIPASPQGGNAIISWDSTGGGNMNNANSLATGFDLYAYIDTSPLNISTDDTEWEQSTYGIGSTDPFFSSYDPTNIIAPLQGWDRTTNSNTGIGWIYQRVEDARDPALEAAELMLVDFGAGGTSLPGSGDWTVIQSFDMSGEASDWHRLSIDFDPNTGEVVARMDDQTFNFTTSTDLIGTFYTGYREALSGGVPAVVRPPTFDMFVEATDNPDLNDDGKVDGDDFLAIQRTDSSLIGAWQAQYGSGSAVPSGAAVPEPASALLLLVGCAALYCRKSR